MKFSNSNVMNAVLQNMRADSVEFLSKTLLMFQVLVINSLRVIGCQWRNNHDKTPTYM